MPSDDVENEAITGQEPRPLCLSCVRPVDPLEHDCPRCGETVGAYTPYIPFVNIRFQYNFLGRVWRHMRGDAGDLPPVRRALLFVFLLVADPLMVLVGLPFLLLRGARGPGAPGAPPHPESSRVFL